MFLERKNGLVGLLAICLPIFAMADAKLDEVEARVMKALHGKTLQSIKKIPVSDLYEIVFDGNLLYVTEDVRYAIQGQITDMRAGKNITEPRINQIRADSIAAVSDEDVILFSPKNPKHTITVFTDIDCGYCRKLHNQIDEYNDLGIAIRYMMFPRSGPRTESFYKAVSVMCSDDRKAALTNAKAGSSVKQVKCDNPVAMHYALGKEVGVRGTPALYLKSGESLPGYVPPKALLQELEKRG